MYSCAFVSIFQALGNPVIIRVDFKWSASLDYPIGYYLRLSTLHTKLVLDIKFP